MNILDNIESSASDIRDVFAEKPKFVIRPDVTRETFLRENHDYRVWLAVVCGFTQYNATVCRLYEEKLSRLYDTICEFPDVTECSPLWVVTMGESLIPGVARGYELCFGINADVRSVYKALHLIYGLCSLLWLENRHMDVPVAVLYLYGGDMCRTYFRRDFFKDFYEYRHNGKIKGMYGAWKVCATKLVGRQFMYFKEDEFERIVDKCSDWFNRTTIFLRNDSYMPTIDDISRSRTLARIPDEKDKFERYCGKFLLG